jgi:hypothetical protein
MARKSVGVAWVLVALSTLTVRAESDEPRRGSLSVVWVDVAATAPWAYPVAAHEVTALLERMDVHGLVERGDVHSVVTGSEVIVVLLPHRPPRSRLSEGAMGATSKSEESPRALAVFAAEVSRTLGFATEPGVWSPIQRRDFAVALGRVVVHELVHTVIPDRPHDRRGLMAASLNRYQLLCSAPAIAPETAEAFRSALGALPASEPTLVASLPWLAGGAPGSGDRRPIISRHVPRP